MRRYGRDTTQISVRTGETFLVELSARATAGYEWQVTQVPDVTALVAARVRAGGPALGAASVQEFEFRATTTGAGTLRLSCGRSWEDRRSEHMEVSVRVER